MLPADAAAEAKSQQNSEMPSAANGTSRADTSPCSSRAHCMEPTPTPIANTDSSSVSTVPSECSVSRATTGNSVISVAPMVQNHDRPRTDSQIGRMAAAWRVTRQVSANTFGAMRSDGSAAGDVGIMQAATSPSSASASTGRADPGGAVRQQHQCAARDGAADDRQECRRLDHAVAGDQFVLGQMFRQQAVFHRPEQRGLHAEPGQHGEQRRHALGQERRGRRGHQHHLGQLVGQDDARLGESVGQLPSRGRKQNVGRDEQRAGERRQAGAADAELEQRQHDHGVLHQVVVQRAARLRQRQRPQPPRPQQCHQSSPSPRGRGPGGGGRRHTHRYQPMA